MDRWEELGRILSAREQRLLLIEAGAGGAISTAATAAPGASRWFAGSLVAYSDALKEQWLSLDPDLILRHGAVSEQTIQGLLLGAPQEMDWVFAESGIYGPSGARPGKPVGLVCVGLRSPNGQLRTESWQLSGDRQQNRKEMQDRSARWLRQQISPAPGR